jgi:hypothetical protein
MMNLFSRLQGGNKKSDKLSYDLPEGLRTQIIQIWQKGFGPDDRYSPGPSVAYKRIHQILCEEHQEFQLPQMSRHSLPYGEIVAEYFYYLQDKNKALDVIQVVFRTMEEMLHRTPNAWGDDMFSASRYNAKDIIEELNRRFRENNVGYEYVQGQIIKHDSQFIHSQIVAPALQVLTQSYLAGANQEFLSANVHFREGRFKECINDCLKAFESAMKAICHKRGWLYKQTDTAKALIKVCEDNKLFPVFMESHLTGLRTSLEGGVPTARNKTSGHGQGPVPTTVTEEFASYVMNLTATNLRFLAESEEKLK